MGAGPVVEAMERLGLSSQTLIEASPKRACAPPLPPCRVSPTRPTQVPRRRTHGRGGGVREPRTGSRGHRPISWAAIHSRRRERQGRASRTCRRRSGHRRRDCRAGPARDHTAHRRAGHSDSGTGDADSLGSLAGQERANLGGPPFKLQSYLDFVQRQKWYGALRACSSCVDQRFHETIKQWRWDFCDVRRRC